MNYLKLILLICLPACVETGKLPVRLESRKVLSFLVQHESSNLKSEKRTFSYYKDLDLRKETYNDTVVYYLHGREIFAGPISKYWYQPEVFDNTHLLISYGVWQGFGPAGPDNISRDTVIIIDLKTAAINIANFAGSYITRDKDFLIKNYGSRTEEQLKKYKGFCAIDDINLKEHSVVLYNQNFQLEYYSTKEENSPYHCQ